MTAKKIKNEQKLEKVQKSGHTSKKNMTAIKTPVANKRPKVAPKPMIEAPEEIVQTCTPTLGDILDKIHKACDTRSLSVGSRRSAVSMANTMFKKYGRLPTVEEVTKDAANPKQKGNFRWLLKLVA